MNNLIYNFLFVRGTVVFTFGNQRYGKWREVIDMQSCLRTMSIVRIKALLLYTSIMGHVFQQESYVPSHIESIKIIVL